MHDVLVKREGEDFQYVLADVFNPASNVERQSRLRLTNWGPNVRTLTIDATDDAGDYAGPVELTLPVGHSRMLTAVDLEQGAHGLEGKLGDGAGKWSVRVAPRDFQGRLDGIVGQNLLYSASGHISNLSAGGYYAVQVSDIPDGSTGTGDEDEFPNSLLTKLHRDNLLVLHAAEDIDGSDLDALDQPDARVHFQTYAKHFYRWFADEFDYLIFVSNLEDKPPLFYHGVYMSVTNDTLGLGRDRFFDNRFGSAGKLRGVIHFPYRNGLLYGPGLHELQHAWGNYAVPTAVRSHWGFSSADGQLGGFDRSELRWWGNYRYSAGNFGTFANGGNGLPYSLIELYFAGYVPPEEVPDLWFAPDGEWLVANDELVRTEDGHAIFTARDVRDYTIEDIVAENGPRVPAMAEAPWHHRAAVVLLVDDDHPPTRAQLDGLSEHVRQFSSPYADDDRGGYNYYEATGTRGTITMDGLAALRRQTSSEPTPPQSFGSLPAPHYCWLTPNGRVVHRAPPWLE